MQDKGVETEKERIAIVGGGLAGLVAAYQLAKSGASVTLFEKSGSLGGRASTALKEGFSLNQGPHALYKGGAAYKFLTDIGARPEGAAPSAGSALALYEGKLYDLPVDLKSLLRTKIFGLAEKIELALFFSRLPKIAVESIMGRSLKSWLEASFKAPKVRTVVQAFARLASYSNNSEAMSAGAAMRQLVIANEGVLYLHNGWSSIVHSLTSALGDSVSFRLNARIKSVAQIESGVEILSETGSERFDKVVLALPPDVVNTLVPDVLERSINEDIKSSHAACLDICLKKLPVKENTFVLGIDEPLYLSVHSASAQLAPSGQALIHLAVYLKEGEHGGDEQKNRLYRMLDQAQPGWRDELVYERYLPNMNTSFGMATAALGGANGLIDPQLKSTEGGPMEIYVCGDWVGAGYLLADAAVDSALKVSALIGQCAKAPARRNLVAK